MPIGSKNSSRRISPGCTAQPAGPSFLILMIAFPFILCTCEESGVIRDLCLVSIAIPPDEANPELIVDSNAVLNFPVTTQRLQPVAGRNADPPTSSIKDVYALRFPLPAKYPARACPVYDFFTRATCSGVP